MPAESASKLGHLSVVQSDWARLLIQDFESVEGSSVDQSGTQWTTFDPTGIESLRNVWAVDGSYVAIRSAGHPPKEVAFVKTALLTVDRVKLESIDKEHPHPLLLRDVLSGSAIFHATVLPLKNVKTSKGSNYDAVRNILNDSMRVDEGGAFYETLKWLAYKKWDSALCRSPGFSCPHCHSELSSGLPPDADGGACDGCGEEVFLSDMLGFHLDMDEDSAPDSVASAYMLMMEHLMLFTAVRVLWGHSDKSLVSDTLFIKDGPLTLRSQYSKLVPSIRTFLQHAKEVKRPVHMIGQEKTGAFVDSAFPCTP